jgi:hypothetical protein
MIEKKVMFCETRTERSVEVFRGRHSHPLPRASVTDRYRQVRVYYGPLLTQKYWKSQPFTQKGQRSPSAFQ